MMYLIPNNMKTKISILLMIASLFLIINCQRQDSTDTYVYTSKNPSENPLYLYVDDKYMGELPYLESNAIDDISSSKAFHFKLKFGTHIMTAKDKKGNDVSALKIEVERNRTTSYDIIGGHSQSAKGLIKRGIILDMF